MSEKKINKDKLPKEIAVFVHRFTEFEHSSSCHNVIDYAADHSKGYLLDKKSPKTVEGAIVILIPTGKRPLWYKSTGSDFSNNVEWYSYDGTDETLTIWRIKK